MISIFIPVYNEEQILADNAQTLHKFLNEQNLEHEIVVVSNGSTDRTTEIGKELQTKLPWFRFFETDERGAGRAFALGVKEARGEFLITVDADLSSGLDFIPSALNLLKHNEMVVGSKSLGQQKRSLIRIVASQLYISIAQTVFDLNVTDYSIGVKGFRRESLLPILAHLDKWTGYIFEICLYLHCHQKQIVQIGVTCEDTRKSHFNLMHEGVYRYHHLFKCWLIFRNKNSWLYS
jgi:glycosyltransferase involved in cell wall biosynthesis